MHTNNISLGISLPKLGIFSLNHYLVFTDNSADTYRSYINKIDGAPAGSSLTTYKNVDRLWSANLNITYQIYIRSIKSSLTFKPSFNFDETPSLRENQLIRRRRYSPGVDLSLSSNFSRTVKFTLGSATHYNYSKNSAGDTDKYLQESLTANTTIDNIFKHLVFNASYNGIFYRSFGDRSQYMG